MNYLALGDSISIDDYTGVQNGGAASQFARLVGTTHFENLTRDGRTTTGVLESLTHITAKPDVITLTAGGNDFLQGAFDIVRHLNGATWESLTHATLGNLARIADHLETFGCPVILNTIYDPTDGDDSLLAQFGVGADARAAYNVLNGGIRTLARQHNFLLSDLEILFLGHGVLSQEDTWIVSQIEPNLTGATEIAEHWHYLFSAGFR